MALIEFKDLPDTTTPLTADNLNNNFGELDDRLEVTESGVSTMGNSAVFAKSNTQNLPQEARTTIQFNQTSVSNEYFELLNDGTIKVLKDISAVLATVNIRFANDTNDVAALVYVDIKNKSNSGFNAETRGIGMLNASGILFVEKNDIIRVDAYGIGNGNYVYGYNRSWCAINLVVLK
jgi:hypothetical protein